MSSEFPTLVLVGRQEQNYYKKPFSFHFFIKIFVATLLPQRWKTLLHCHSSIPGDGKHCYIVTLLPPGGKRAPFPCQNLFRSCCRGSAGMTLLSLSPLSLKAFFRKEIGIFTGPASNILFISRLSS